MCVFWVLQQCIFSLTTTGRITAIPSGGIRDFEFSGLSGSYWGGGAINLEPHRTNPVEVINCNFISNTNGFKSDQTEEGKFRGGGAICMQYAPLHCTSCNFTNCVAKSGWGGAIFCLGTNQHPGVFKSCEFTTCKCEHLADIPEQFKGLGGGGAVGMKGCFLTLESCLFTVVPAPTLTMLITVVLSSP